MGVSEHSRDPKTLLMDIDSMAVYSNTQLIVDHSTSLGFIMTFNTAKVLCHQSEAIVRGSNSRPDEIVRSKQAITICSSFVFYSHLFCALAKCSKKSGKEEQTQWGTS